MHANVDETPGSVGSPTAIRTPRQPAIDHDIARRLMTTEYARVVDMLRRLPASDWSRPTCNTGNTKGSRLQP